MSEIYDRAAHLEMIQGVITRMASNCFQCKTWAMTLFSALAVVILTAGDKTNIIFAAVVALIMLIIFWSLDAWYLQMERLFRRLFNDVRKESIPSDISSMNDPYRMNYKKYSWEEESVLRIMFSSSILPVYLTPAIITVAYGAYIYFTV